MSLFKNDSKNKKLQTCLSVIYEYQTMLTRIRYPLNKQAHLDKKSPYHPYYGFIPNNPLIILNLLIEANKYLNNLYTNQINKEIQPKFLDVGCGMGNVMIIANALGFKTYGIEFDHKIVQLVKKLHNPQIKKGIIKDDITTYTNYSKYDIIYYYVPIKNGDIMQDCAKRIADQAKDNAIIIPCGFSYTFVKDERFKSISEGSMFIKTNKVRSTY